MCQTTTNEKLIYFPSNSCKLQKHLANSKSRPLKSALSGKIYALLQDVLLVAEPDFFLNFEARLFLKNPPPPAPRQKIKSSTHWKENELGRVKRILYLSPMRAAKVQASLRIRAVSPEPLLLAHTSSESRGTFRQKTRSLALLNCLACAVKVCHDGRHKFAWRGPIHKKMTKRLLTKSVNIDYIYLSRITRKCVFEHFRPAMTQTGLLSYSD